MVGVERRMGNWPQFDCATSEAPMNTFAIVITLSAMIGPQVSYFGPDRPFEDQADCQRALSKAEGAVEAIIRRDPDSLALFGQVTGTVTRGYFISESWCLPIGATP
jgi:hypothetical protein